MLRTYLYVPVHISNKVKRIAKIKNKSKAQVIRDALEKGLNQVEDKQSASIDAMFKISDLGKKSGISGPRDSSTNLDKYLWG